MSDEVVPWPPIWVPGHKRSPEFVELAEKVLLRLCRHEADSSAASASFALPEFERLLGLRAVRITEGFFEALSGENSEDDDE